MSASIMYRTLPRLRKALRSPLLMRSLATVLPVHASSGNHKVVVVGCGSAGITLIHQLLRTGKFAPHDIAVVDPSTSHDYQPGWTLVGAGLKTKEELRKPLAGMIDPKLKFYNEAVASFTPDDNSLRLANGMNLTYEQLVVAPGIKIDFASIKGLQEALADPKALVSSTYGYDTCEKVYRTIQNFRKGTAIFTHPAGLVKCAGAPQKIMWLGLDYWKKRGLYDAMNPSRSAINITFATAMGVMFGVPKYSERLNEMRVERNVQGLFQHDLVAVDGNTATFARLDQKDQITKMFNFLHVVPKMGPHEFVKSSVLANEAGLVDVNQTTTRHNRFANVWSIGDASSLPTSKTAAAITAQAPVLVKNMLQAMEGKALPAQYGGYTSCPLLTEYGKVMLAEFSYGGKPTETFSRLGLDQATPRRAFYHLKKDFFPWVYYKSMVKGTWGGPNGWLN